MAGNGTAVSVSMEGSEGFVDALSRLLSAAWDKSPTLVWFCFIMLFVCFIFRTYCKHYRREERELDARVPKVDKASSKRKASGGKNA